jgi:hypothetical protein
MRWCGGEQAGEPGWCTAGERPVKVCRRGLRRSVTRSNLRSAVDLEDERDEAYPDVGELTEEQLEAELTVAASAPDHRRMERYRALLAERERREQERG